MTETLCEVLCLELGPIRVNLCAFHKGSVLVAGPVHALTFIIHLCMGSLTQLENSEGHCAVVGSVLTGPRFVSFQVL